MWRLRRTDTFARTARRLLERDPKLVEPFAAALVLLEADPHDRRLKLHRLRGRLKGLWAARVTYRVRLVLILDDQGQEATLLDVGSHDEVYR